jgi:hypothetical protein
MLAHFVASGGNPVAFFLAPSGKVAPGKSLALRHARMPLSGTPHHAALLIEQV